MTTSRFHYSYAELVAALGACGVRSGEVLYCHVSLPRLGLCREVIEEHRHPGQLLLDALLEVLGPQGTLIVPTYTYSFCRGEIFDPASSRSTVGAFGEWLRQRAGVVRSLDPLFSCAGYGPRAAPLFAGLPPTSFGKDCLYARLLEVGARALAIGLEADWFTAQYHLEWLLKIPYRYDKQFYGSIHGPEGLQECCWTYFVRVPLQATLPHAGAFQKLCQKAGVLTTVKLGGDFINALPLKDFFDTCAQPLAQDPWQIVQGPPFLITPEMRT